MASTDIQNRLEKNIKKLKPWAEKLGIEAYRIYDRDIPEYPFTVDIYGPYVVMNDRRQDIDFEEQKSGHLENIRTAIQALLKPQDIIIKRRTPQRLKGQKTAQYQRLAEKGERIAVKEEPAKFLVNLYDYLDTGLFLDHRLVRQIIYKKSGMGARFLNLFSYTSSVSVMAAIAGSITTSVDMSKTYTNWAKDNFKANNIDVDNHNFFVADVLVWLHEQFVHKSATHYDLIFLDPPTFSNSKKMDGTFDVERDQVQLLRKTVALLRPGGELIFSNNKRGFKLDPAVHEFAKVKEITHTTLPKDFHDQKIRKVFSLERLEGADFTPTAEDTAPKTRAAVEDEHDDSSEDDDRLVSAFDDFGDD